jgi:hypothetical protein
MNNWRFGSFAREHRGIDPMPLRYSLDLGPPNR